VAQLRTPPRHPRVDYAGSRVFFVTFCVWDRVRVFATPAAASAMREVLFRYREREWYWILSYCIMPDHVHILMKLRSSLHHLSRIVATWKHESMKSIMSTGEKFRWKYGYYDRVLRGDEAEFDVARYVTQNPVRAGIVREADEYQFAGIVDRFW
jgi:putative transposase